MASEETGAASAAKPIRRACDECSELILETVCTYLQLLTSYRAAEAGMLEESGWV